MPVSGLTPVDLRIVRPLQIDGRIAHVDLAALGFSLIGGRLDYLDHRTVAAMVYRHGKHPINLFVWANPSQTLGQPEATSRQGYNIRHWVQGDMTYWLISDVDADVLAQLEALLRQPN